MSKGATMSVIVIAALVAAGVYFFMPQSVSAPEAENTTYTWQISELEQSTTTPGMPRSRVALEANGSTHQIGEYDGTCAVIEGTAWDLLEGEKSGVICWWAGGGSEIGVFEENGTMVVKQGDLEEGSAETPGLRGNFRTILSL
jgi:hypothetical protein